MGKRVKTVLACLTAVLFAVPAWATGEVISVNVIGGNSGRDGKSISAGKSAGAVSVPADFWNQLAERSAGDSFSETASTLQEWAQGREAPKTVGVGLTLRAACCYTAGTTATNGNAEMLYGYLDDGTTDTGYGAQAVFSGIPYSQYDLYVYLGSDSDGTAGSGFGPVEVNGTWYPAQGTAWGSRSASRQAEATLTENTNYVKVSGLTASTLTIRGAGSGAPAGTRTGLAGFQIVNTGEVFTARTLTASPEGDATFGAIAWDGEAEAPRSIDSVELTLTPGATLTFDTFPELAKMSLSCGGSVTLAGSVEGATAESLLAGVRTLDFSGVTGTVDMALAATQNLSAQPWRYAGGGGSADATLRILNDGGTVSIGGGTYHLSERVSGTATTVTMKDSKAIYSDGLGIGTATYEFDGATTVTTPKLVLSQGANNRTAELTLKGTAALTVTGESNPDSNQASIMFGHWNGPSTFTLRDSATFTAEKAQVLIGKTGNNHTINIEGGIFTAQGIKLASIASGTNILNLSGGTLRLGEVGLGTYAADKTLAVNVSNTPALEASADFSVTHAVALAEGSVLTVKPNGHTITFARDFTGAGALRLEGEGVVDLSALTSLPAFAGVAEGITLRVPLFADVGALEGMLTGTKPTVTFRPLAGGTISGTVEGGYAGAKQEATITRNEDGSVTATATIPPNGAYAGSAWHWDYEFTGDLSNSGSDTTALSQDDSAPLYVTLDEATGNKAVMFKSTPYRSVTYGTAFTAVMRCQPAAVANTALLGFGTKGGTCIILATGENPAAGDMRLCLWQNGTLTDLVAGLNIPSATTAPHLYAFTLAVVDGKTQIAVYVDGKRKTVYKAEGTITLGGGFQIGSVHGGIVSGLTKYAADAGTLDFLRTTSGTLTMAAMQSIADAYREEPVAGTATRTVGAGGGDWVASGDTPWQQRLPGQEAAVAQAAPNAGTNVTLTTQGAATLTLNLPEATAYESLEVVGDGLRLTVAEGNATTMTVGDLSVRADLTLPLGALSIGTLAVSTGKTLTFDLSGFDFATVWETRTIPLTGLAQLGVGASVKLSGFEADTIAPRTAEVVFDEKTESYNLVIRVPEGGLTATVDGTKNWSALVWMLGDTPIPAPDWSSETDVVATLRVSGAATLRMDMPATLASFAVEAAGADAQLTVEGESGNTLTVGALALGVDATFSEGAVALASSAVTLAGGVTLTLDESMVDLTRIRPAAGVTKATRPTVAFVRNCAITVPSNSTTTPWHGLNLFVGEGAACTLTTFQQRVDMCGVRLEVAGSLTFQKDVWLGVSYGSLSDADSEVVVRSTGSVTFGTVLLGGWGNTLMNRFETAGTLILRTLNYAGASTLAVAVEGAGMFALDGTTGTAANAVSDVTVAEGGAARLCGTLRGALAFASGAALDASGGAATVTGDVSFAGALTVRLGEGFTATEAGTQVLAKAGVPVPEGTVTLMAGEANVEDAFLEAREAEGLYVRRPTLTPPAGQTFSDDVAKALATAAVQNGVRTLTISADSDPIDGAALFENVVSIVPDGEGSTQGTATVDYDFGIQSMTVRAINGQLCVVLAAKVQGVAENVTYAKGTSVKVYCVERTSNGGTDATGTLSEIEGQESADSLPGTSGTEPGVKWVYFPYDTLGDMSTFYFKVKASTVTTP